MEIRKLSGNVAAEIEGVRIGALDPGAPDSEALRQALYRHRVLILRDQDLDLAGLKRATAVFGPLLRVPYIAPAPEDPDIVRVLKEQDERDIAVFGGDWHSDFSFLDEPPGGSLLWAVEVPPYGGDTVWADQIAAWASLPANLKTALDGKRVIHLGAPYGVDHAPPPDLAVSRSVSMTRGDPDADRPRLHPSPRTYPPTGEKALFVNPIYTVGIEGLPESEAAEILKAAYAHATRPEFCYRHRWQAGDLAIWDNRATLHYAVNDYDGHRRLLYRTTWAGEAPV
ncbi:MAG: TauD/TfdA family dioxygenase [Alphaproteobacteria bacterium]|nr:TauD/TfdA family dioxygenase [Alphaproteobacteria bacterium]